jgi:hypothetical protein
MGKGSGQLPVISEEEEGRLATESGHRGDRFFAK